MRGPACSPVQQLSIVNSNIADQAGSHIGCNAAGGPRGGTIRTRSHIRRRLLVMLLAGGTVVLSGCEPTESVQWGYRGNSMTQLYTPGRLNELVKLNEIPAPEPSDPYDPTFPMATEVHQNVQVLTDLNALEFARLMNALSTWIAPEEGCAYCHNPENLAEDSKYTKLVARQMIKMTRDINANWSSHVAQTGVTCWTCHRGKAVPSDIWFTTPKPKTPSSGLTGWKGGQNLAGVANSGYSSLPYDPLTPFLLDETDVRVQGTEVLPYGNRQSIKQTEWTYSLMMYISQSLGVNCTYCHQTRAMGRWEESTPQRVTAWHGIRMVRNMNQDHLVPLLDLYPKERLGPLGDAPKAACATCHKGSYKPLFGFSMLDDYPSLRGVLPGRLSPDPTEGGTIPVAWAPEGTTMASMEERQQAAELLAAQAAEEAASAEAEAQAESAADEAAAPETALSGGEPAAEAEDVSEDIVAEAAEPEAPAPAEEAVATPPSESRSLFGALKFWGRSQRAVVEEPKTLEAVAGTTTPEAVATVPAAVEDMDIAEIEATIDQLLEKLRAARAELEAAKTAPAAEEPAPEPSDEADNGASAAPSEAGDAGDAASDESTPPATAEGVEESGEGEVSAAPEEVEQDIAEAEGTEVSAEPEPTTTTGTAAAETTSAVESDLDAEEAATAEADQSAVSEVTDKADAIEANAQSIADEAEQVRAALASETAESGDSEPSVRTLDEAEALIVALNARLDQETTALEQQLRLVREQRDQAANAVRAELRDVHADALDAAEDRLQAVQARLDQQRTALEQQLAVVRAQRDEALVEAASRIAAREHAALIAAAEHRIAAIEARLNQQTLALEQQLEAVRGQRDAAYAEAARRVPLDEHFAALAAVEDALTAMRARLEQQTHALGQQLALVRAQRDTVAEELASSIPPDVYYDALEAKNDELVAMRARLEQQTHALDQQLDIVRAQRDAAKTELMARIPPEEHRAAIDTLEQRITTLQARLDQSRHALEQQLQVVRAQRDDAVAQTEERPAAPEDEDIQDARQAQDRQLAETAAPKDQADVTAEAEAPASTSTQAQALTEVPAETTAAADRQRALAEVAEAIGAEVTDDGIIVELGGDRLRFASGSAALPAGELPDLDRTAKLLSDYPELAARIEGHTDSVGSAALNQRLSQQRAEAVMAALVDRGVAASRLNAEGLGPDRPIASNATPDGRSRNRRVEIYITTLEQVANGGPG